MSRWLKCSLVGVVVAAAGCAIVPAPHEPAASAEAKAVEFLKREVPAWSREHGCFSCHNNGDGARALYAASRKGYHIPTSALADTTAWVTQPSRWEHNKGEAGFSDLRLANVQFAASLLAAYENGHVKDRRPLQEAARKVAGDQAPNGAWPIEPEGTIGSPATYGSVLATFSALQILLRADLPETVDAVRKAETWLRRAKPENIPAAATLLMVAAKDTDESSRTRLNQLLNFLREAQAHDGGWGPYADAPPEVFDTAIVLLALNELRDTPNLTDLIRRGRNYLITHQEADGGWAATTRPSGGASYAQRISTTGWATLALLATRD